MKTYKIQQKVGNSWITLMNSIQVDMEFISIYDAKTIAIMYVTNTLANYRIVDSEGNYHPI